MKRGWLSAVAAACVAIGMAASNAEASSIYQRSGGGDWDLVIAGGDEANTVTVRQLNGPSGPYFEFTDLTSPITSLYSICSSVSLNIATCPTTWDYGGGEFATFDVDAEVHGGNDSVEMRTNRPSGIDGGNGADTLKGGSSNDTILGDGFNTTDGGTPGGDWIDGRGGADKMYGGVFSGPGGDGSGTDVVSFESRSTAIFASLDGTANDGGFGEGDNIEGSIEEVRGTNAGDTFTGDANANRFFGFGGFDVMNGLGGNDALFGGDTIDSMDGGGGNDTVTGEGGADTLRGGGGTDSLTGGDDDDALLGGGGADDMSGGPGAADAVDYTGTAGDVTVTPDDSPNDGAGEGDNVHSDVERIFGGPGNDTLTPVDFGEVWGRGGNDTLFGGGQDGDDRLEGGDGNDTLDGRFGADLLNGGGGVDTIDYTDHVVIEDFGRFGVNSIPNGIADDGNGFIDRSASTGAFDNVDNDVENVIGTVAPDNLQGTAAGNRLLGSGDADSITGAGGGDDLQGGGGDDAINGGPDDDSLLGEAGNDSLDGSTGADTTDGGPDVDTANYGSRNKDLRITLDDVANDGDTAAAEGDNVRSSTENVRAGSGDDALVGSAAPNRLIGGPGDDSSTGATAPT